MRIRKRLRDFMRGVRPEPPYERARTFESGSTDPRAILEDIRNRYDHESDLLHHFVDNRGPVVHKWHHYIPLYDRYLSRFRKRIVSKQSSPAWVARGVAKPMSSAEERL